MTIASDSSAESQHDRASVDVAPEASVLTEQQQMTLTPGTSELLDRVVTDFRQAFQSSLVQVRAKTVVLATQEEEERSGRAALSPLVLPSPCCEQKFPDWKMRSNH